MEELAPKSDGKPQQLELWNRLDLDPTMRLKAAMREAIRLSGLSREKVVADMNDLATESGLTTNGRGEKVTLPLLEKWVAPSAEGHRIPVHYLSLFCLVTRSGLPLDALALAIGCRVISADDQRLLEWAKVETARRKLGRDARRLAQEVGIK